MSATQTQCPSITSPPRTVTQYDPQAFGNSGVVHAAPCTLLGAFGTNKSTLALFIQFFNSTTVPADTAIPVMAPLEIAAGDCFKLNLTDIGVDGLNGLTLSTGLCWAASTTAGTLTQDATASVWISVRYA